MRDDDEQDELEQLRSKTETTLREGKIRGMLALGSGTQADTQVRGRQRGPGVSFDTFVEDVTEAESTNTGEPTLPRAGGTEEVTDVAAGAPTGLQARHRSQDARALARSTTDEAARGFPLPPPPSEEAEDEHTEVQAGPPGIVMGMGFIPEEYGLGPGFASVSQTGLPLARGAKQNPLPGVAPMPVSVPTPAPIIESVAKPVSVVKSVPALMPTDWNELPTQPVASERHLTPQRVALTGSLKSLTGFIRLSRSQRWIALTVLLLGAGGLLLLLRSAGGEKKRSSVASSHGTDSALLAEHDAGVSSPDAQILEAQSANDPDPVPEPEVEPEPEIDKVDTPKKKPAKARKLRNRGRRLFKRGKHAAALRLYQEALKLDPTAAAIQRDLGQLHHRQGDWSQAREAYRKYLELAPKARDARTIRGRLNRLRKR